VSDIVSGATRRGFQESYVSYSVVGQIESDFDDAGVERGEIEAGRMVSGARRGLVAEYYASVKWDDYSSVRHVLDAYETHLLRLQESTPEEHQRLVKLLRRDKLSVEDGRISLPGHDVSLEEIVDERLTVDLDQLRVNISRIRSAISTDPALAVGSSKELVEATCKAILAERNVEISEGADLPELVHAVLENLDLLAKNVAAEKKGAQSIKRVLGSLSQVVQGLAELRNLYGSGHGKAPGERGLSARHARLCAGAASTFATFLMETAVQRRDT
jgi:Abortive infection C-terminus